MNIKYYVLYIRFDEVSDPYFVQTESYQTLEEAEASIPTTRPPNVIRIIAKQNRDQSDFIKQV